MKITKFIGLVILFGFMYSCHSFRQPATVPLTTPPAAGYSETGMASWYGPEFHGRKTSSLEIYNMNDLTAAHRTLPFGTLVQVTNLENGRTVAVRINDRGPFLKDRIIDLSYAAARMLGMIGPGTARVKIEVIGFKPIEEIPRPGEIILQLGAFLNPENARALYKEIKNLVPSVFISPYQTSDKTFYRVRIRAESELEAKNLAEKLASAGYPVLIINQ
ncbi:MAG: septal ring lytic transglycosylase RlpA family protein [Candidatus Saccharicenans sp.]|nr:MAG: septal ring lytic transglycosylase RlpA family protein [Candidatus Aminicenantes bacterium]HEK85829.1 septal ring lytic transglycosylase RlpA family protein [Candidatus Aminicenantes bacterium]